MSPGRAPLGARPASREASGVPASGATAAGSPASGAAEAWGSERRPWPSGVQPAPRAPASWLVLGSWALLVAALGAAVALRFVGLEHLPGINGDEAVFPVHAAEWRSGVPLSSLRTGTDLPMNPVFFGLVALVQAWLPATFWSLRLPALVLSVLAVAFAFVAFRRRGAAFATIFALLLAVLPIQLGYARLAWDPTAVPTVLVLALAAATRSSVLGVALMFALGLWVHPTTVFAAPVLLAPLIAARWPRDSEGRARRPGGRAAAVAVAGCAALLAAGYWLAAEGLLPTPVQAVVRGELAQQVVERATSIDAALRFAQLYADFVSGPTLYRYVVGSLPSWAGWAHVAAACVVLVGVVLPALRRLPAATRSADLAVGVGLVVSLVGAYLVGGLRVLEPNTERYGMFLVAPTCYVLAVCIDAFASSPRRAALARLGAGILGGLCLLSFCVYFLAPLHTADPARHDTFRTGPVDPKERALEAVLASRAPDRLTLVRVEDWWIYWPMRYLLGARDDVRVTIEGSRRGRQPFPRDFEPPRPAPGTADVFGVAWAGSQLDAKYARRARERFDVGGHEPGPILRVYRLRESAPAGAVGPRGPSPAAPAE